MLWCGQLHDPAPAEASGKISVANSRCQTNIQVRPWSHPAAEQHPGGRNNMIQSDLQSCLEACSKSWEHLIKDSSRDKSPSLASHVSKNKFKGMNSSPAMPLLPHRYCLLPELNAEWGHSVSHPTVLASQAYPRAVSFKKVFVFNHCNYYKHFINQEAANIPLYGSMWSTIKIHTSNDAWAQKFMKSAHLCQLYFHSA